MLRLDLLLLLSAPHQYQPFYAKLQELHFHLHSEYIIVNTALRLASSLQSLAYSVLNHSVHTRDFYFFNSHIFGYSLAIRTNCCYYFECMEVNGWEALNSSWLPLFFIYILYKYYRNIYILVTYIFSNFVRKTTVSLNLLLLSSLLKTWPLFVVPSWFSFQPNINL